MDEITRRRLMKVADKGTTVLVIHLEATHQDMLLPMMIMRDPEAMSGAVIIKIHESIHSGITQERDEGDIHEYAIMVLSGLDVTPTKLSIHVSVLLFKTLEAYASSYLLYVDKCQREGMESHILWRGVIEDYIAATTSEDSVLRDVLDTREYAEYAVAYDN